MKRIAIVLGTRPEIIKLAGLVKILKKRKGVATTVVYTGQHYDYNLCQVFMEELHLPKIDIGLETKGESGMQQAALMVKKLSELFSRKKFDVVVAEGDTNSVLAAALAASHCNVRFAHVEAGLRSNDWRMPEESNRVIADCVSHYAFAPTRASLRNLRESCFREKGIYLTGNTIVEAVQENMEMAKNSKILEKLGLCPGKYAVLTAHRQEYVESRHNLEQLLKALARIDTKIVFPVHPRTAKNLKKFGLWARAKKIRNLCLTAPVGYFDFLKLAGNSMFLLSDSGGIQEEASVYKKFVVILRDNTERPEILGKFGELTGYNAKKIVRAANRIVKNSEKMNRKLKGRKCPFGDGKASERIAEILVKGK